MERLGRRLLRGQVRHQGGRDDRLRHQGAETTGYATRAAETTGTVTTGSGSRPNSTSCRCPGRLRSTEETYATKTDAEVAPSLIESDITRGQWSDPDAGEPTVVRAYQALRAILNTAVDDELIRRNPCRIKGGSLRRTGTARPHRGGGVRGSRRNGPVLPAARSAGVSTGCPFCWRPSPDCALTSWRRSADGTCTWPVCCGRGPALAGRDADRNALPQGAEIRRRCSHRGARVCVS